MNTPRKRNYTIINKARATYRRTKPNCAICGKPINYNAHRDDNDALNVDHIIAFTKGGTDTMNNYQPAHRACNSKKRARDHAPIIKRSNSLNP